MINNPEKSYLQTGLAASLLPKRDHLAAYLAKAGMNPIVPDAGYFMLADYSKIGNVVFIIEQDAYVKEREKSRKNAKRLNSIHGAHSRWAV